MHDQIERAKHALNLYTAAQKWRCGHDDVLDAALALSTALRDLLEGLDS